MDKARRMQKASIGTLAFVLCMCLGPSLLWAQKVTGTISGTVVDTSGAVIPGVTIVVTNESTSVTIFRTTTDSSGAYTIPAVQPGSYMMTVSHAGFRTLIRRGVVIQVTQNAMVNFTLTVGAITQRVSVTAAPPLLVTQSATISSIVTGQTIANLPLNGRYFFSLTELSTGVTPYAGEDNPSPDAYLGIRGSSPGVQVGGQQPGSNNYTINSIDNEESTVANIVLVPPLDMIQEFNIQTTNQGVQFGKNSGATINVVTKSGTSAFHGDLYEFLRNDKLDAANYFTAPGQKPPFHLNQYGATLGGPIPKNKKTFFFAYWDADKVSQGQTYTSTVPTAAERNGDFSQSGITIYDPQTINLATDLKQPFPNDTIPADRISAPALALTNINYPLPNAPGLVNNFIWYPLRTQNGASFGARIDHQFGAKDYFFTNFMYQDFTLGDPSQLFDPILQDPSVGIPSEITSVPETLNVRGDQVGWTHTFSPTLVSDTHLGFTREYELIPNPLYKTVGLSTALGIPGVNPPYNSSPPYTQGLSDFGVTGYNSLGEPTTPPFMVGDTNFEGVEDMTWIKGKHTIDFGGDAIKRYYNYFQSPTQRGAFDFTGTYTSQLGVTGTGDGYADLLLGIPETLSSAVFSNVSGQRQWESGLYFQDTYHATPKLTLTLGMRYDLLMPRTEEYNRQGNFDTQIPGGAVVLASASSAPCGPSLRCIDWDDIAPRAALAYQINNKTAVRAGFGIFYNDYAVNGFGGFTTGLMLVPPYYRGTTITNSITTPTDTLAEGVLPAIVPQSAIPVVNGYVFPVNGEGFETLAQNPYGKNPYVEEYNFTVERTLAQNILFSLSYVGNQSHRNQYTADVNQAVPGPGSIASRRPFPDWPDINYMEMNGQGSYNSLQLQVRQRTWKGMSFIGSYTYSKSIDDADGEWAGPQNYYDLQQNRGPSAWNYPQVFTFDGIYMLPFGPGRQFGSALTGVPAKLAEGWQINGIYTAMSGYPFTATAAINESNTDSPDGSWANRICNGAISNKTPTEWFNPSCFIEPALYTFGNSGRDILTGPGTSELDFSLFKNTYVSQDRNRYLQFRAEFFNMFNRPEFNNPSGVIGTASAGVLSSAGDEAGFIRTSRQIQFSLKLYF
jgi:Carboxypeptidase regulatory-like domain